MDVALWPFGGKKKKDEPPPPPPPPPAPKWRVVAGNLAAGAIAGCAVEAALYPLDTIKTRMQLMTSGGGVRALFKAGGGKALYAGLWGNLAGVAPASAIFMAVYEPMKQYLTSKGVSAAPQVSFLGAGAAAGLAASFVRVPTEVVKQRLQAGAFGGPAAAVRGILASQGARGLFAGYFAFLLRDLPFDAIEFWAFDTLKIYGQRATKRELRPWENGLAGAAAGAVTGFATTPLDVLKTRLMTQGDTALYKNVFDCAAKIYAREGTAALFRGWEPRVTWIAVGGCVFFSVLEAAKRALVPVESRPDIGLAAAGPH